MPSAAFKHMNLTLLHWDKKCEPSADLVINVLQKDITNHHTNRRLKRHKLPTLKVLLTVLIEIELFL